MFEVMIDFPDSGDDGRGTLDSIALDSPAEGVGKFIGAWPYLLLLQCLFEPIGARFKLMASIVVDLHDYYIVVLVSFYRWPDEWLRDVVLSWANTLKLRFLGTFLGEGAEGRVAWVLSAVGQGLGFVSSRTE